MIPAKLMIPGVVALVAMTPVAFWMTYGTMDACTAFKQTFAQDVSKRHGGFAGAMSGFALSGAVGFGRLNGRKCLKALWKLETEGPEAAEKVVKAG